MVKNLIEVNDAVIMIQRDQYREALNHCRSGFDQEIIPLLDALNKVPGVATRFSCIGHEDKEDQKTFYVMCLATDEGRALLRNIQHELLTHEQTSLVVADGYRLVEGVPGIMSEIDNVIQVSILNFDRAWHDQSEVMKCMYNLIKVLEPYKGE